MNDAPRELVRIGRVATALGCKRETIRKRVAAGEFPPPSHYIGDEGRWDMAVVEEWLREHRGGMP